MRSQEAKVSPASDYYVYAPSALAARLYLYPTSVGYFYYEAGYWIRRNRFDSFLIMYISKGNCHITIPREKTYCQSRTVCASGLLPAPQLWKRRLLGRSVAAF